MPAGAFDLVYTAMREDGLTPDAWCIRQGLISRARRWPTDVRGHKPYNTLESGASARAAPLAHRRARPLESSLALPCSGSCVLACPV